jgi:uncharacterized protein YdeI (YjbR/CyaY-like superfamily)
MAGKELPRHHAPDRKAWRRWLQANHASAAGVWLVYYKKESGKPRVSYDDAVEEALCFGWIDSVVNAIDAERFMQLFTPRKPKSGWSALNKRRVEKLLALGLFHPAGWDKVEAARRDGSWSKLDAAERLEVPEDLARAFLRAKIAHRNFMAFSPSSRKGILNWIGEARRPATRAARIEETVAMARLNLRAQFDKRPVAAPRAPRV